MASPGRAETVVVKSYAGYRAEEKPLSFVLGGENLTVQKVLAQWREEGQDCFKVSCGEGQSYLLRYKRRTDLWTAEKL